MKRTDLIGFVEDCYDLSGSDERWLQQLSDRMYGLVHPGHGMLAYQVVPIGRGFAIQDPVQSGPHDDLTERISALGTLLERSRAGTGNLIDRAKAKIYEGVVRKATREPAGRVVESEYDRVGPDWMYNLGTGVKDVFVLLNHHIDGHGLTAFFGGLTETRSFSWREREAYMMLSAHIKAGLRLRRSLAEVKGVDAPPEGAVLTPSGRVLHADGAAKVAVEALGEAAKRVDQARASKSGRDELALRAWEGLVDGTWSLVEAFDHDGKRYILAHKNPESVADPRGLTDMETRVVGLAVRGYADKLVAYHLGTSEGTASSHLTRAMSKLGVRGRVELVRQLGTAYPQPDL